MRIRQVFTTIDIWLRDFHFGRHEVNYEHSLVTFDALLVYQGRGAKLLVGILLGESRTLLQKLAS